MAIDEDPAETDKLATMAIGHLIVDPSTHPFYPRHLTTLLMACGSRDAARLQQVLSRVRDAGAGLGTQRNVEQLVTTLNTAWYGQTASDLVDASTNLDVLAGIMAAAIRRKSQEQGRDFDLPRFFNLR